jgi:hypothetical protein
MANPRDKIIHERTFSTIDPEDGRRVVVKAQLHSLGGQKPYFSVSSGNGSDHDRIVRIFPELAPIVDMHLSDEDGVPMHGVANLRFHIENGDLDAAMRHARIAKREDLEALAGKIMFSKKPVELAAAEIAVELRTEILADLYTAADKARSYSQYLHNPLNETYRKKDEFRKLAKELAEGREPKTGAERDFFKNLLPNLRVAIEKAKKDLLSAQSKALSQAKKNIDPVSDYVDTLRPEWKRQAEAAIAALKGENIATPDYVEPTADRSTFAGFAAFHGITMTVGKSTPSANKQFSDKHVMWPCTLEKDGKTLTIEFNQNRDNPAPTISDIIECVRNDVSSETSFEDWCEAFGFDTDSRTAERSYQYCVKLQADFEDMVGPEAMKEFLEHVGEDEPVRPFDQDEEEVAAPRM